METISPSSSSISPSTQDPTGRIGWTLLILATLYICYFSHLGALGFVGPDEPRYAWIARDMMETGDWVTPRLYGKPWFEKPPLYYWGAALCFKLLGVSEAAARLPSAVSALLATLAIAWLALRLYGAETARWVLLLLPTTVGMIGFSHAAATDMPFSAMLTIAMVTAAFVMGLIPRDCVDGRIPGKSSHPSSLFTSFISSKSFTSFLFGLSLALAVLAKGPVAIILCGGAVFFWALFTKRWRDALRLLHPAAIAAFCLTALPWYIICARRNPDFLRIFIIEHNFKRYLTPEFQHVQPFWYYVPVLLVASVPWVPTLLWSVSVATMRLLRTQRFSTTTAYFVLWSAFCLFFFSISKSKLPGYILPAIPSVALLQTHSCTAPTHTYRKSLRITIWMGAFVFLGLGVLGEVLAGHGPMWDTSFARAASFVLILIGAANFIFAYYYGARKHASSRHLIAVLCVLPVLAALSFANVFTRSFFRWDRSGRSLAREIQTRKIPMDRLVVTAISRGQRFSLSFYLHQEIRQWDESNPQEGYLLSGRKNCHTLVRPPLICEEVPFNFASTGTFLYRLTPDRSPGGMSSSRQPQ